jgi:hypothetical protein
LAQAAAVLLSLAVASLAVTARAQQFETGFARPPGVAVSAWMPILPRLGFVVEQPASRRHGSTPARGYFMARRRGGWLRLDPIPQDARLRWPLTSRPENGRVRIASHLAFVIEPATRERGDGETSSAFGYFVLERGKHWVRLDPVAHDALFDGPLTTGGSGNAVPITANLRFVIQQLTPGQDGARLGSAFGYFVIQRNGRSLRLNPIGAGQLLKQPQ